MSKKVCENAQKDERKFKDGAKKGKQFTYIRTEFNKFRKGHTARAANIHSVIERVERGRECSTDRKDLCAAAKLCMDYERRLLLIVGCANMPIFTDYEKWRIMYLNAIEALGFRETILNDKKSKGRIIELKRTPSMLFNRIGE